MTTATKTRINAPQTQEGTLAQRLVSSLGDSSVSLADGVLESDVTDWMDTRCAMLNYTMGIAGLPVGRVVTFKGAEGSFKSSVAYHVLAETQARGGLGILIDAERTFDKERGRRMGMKPEELVVAYPDCLEAAFNGVYEDGKLKVPGVVKSTIENARKLGTDFPITIVVDSLSTLAPKKIVDSGATNQPATVAKYMSDNLKLIVPQLARAQATLIIINQLRTFIQMDASLVRRPARRKVMGPDQSMIAEQALIYFSSVILHFTSAGDIGPKDDPTGLRIRVKVSKEKVGPGESKVCEFDGYKDNGVDNTASKLDVLMATKVIEERGGWLKVEGDEKGFRRADWPEVLAARPELEQRAKEAATVWATGGPLKEPDAEDEDDEDDA